MRQPRRTKKERALGWIVHCNGRLFLRFSSRPSIGAAGDGPMDGQLMPGKVVLVEELLPTHLTGKLALPMALHVLVQVQFCLEHFPALPTGKVSPPRVPNGHVTRVGVRGKRDVAAQAARHFRKSVLEWRWARCLEPSGCALSQRLARDRQEGGGGARSTLGRHHALEVERVRGLGVGLHGEGGQVSVQPPHVGPSPRLLGGARGWLQNSSHWGLQLRVC